VSNKVVLGGNFERSRRYVIRIATFIKVMIVVKSNCVDMPI
jgi:hypothetical protein